MLNNINILQINEPTKEQLMDYSRLSSSFISVPMALEWSQLIKQSTQTDMEIIVLEINNNNILIGVAIVTRLKKLRAYQYLWSPVAKAIHHSSLLQKFFPDLDIGFLEVPISNYSGLFTSAETTAEERNILFSELATYFKMNYPMHAFCIKEDAPIVQNSIPEEFSKLSFMPNTSLHLPDKSFADFLARLTSKKRRKLRADRKLLEKEGGTIELIDKPSLISDELYQLYQKTNLRKKMQDDYIPTPLSVDKDFFNNLSSFQLLNSKALVAKVNDEIIGYCLLMKDGDTLYFKSVGLDYDLSFKTHAYFNLFYSSIEYGIEHGCKRIDYGITSYCFKKRMGCELHDSYYLVIFYHSLLHRLGTLFIRLLDKKFSSLEF